MAHQSHRCHPWWANFLSVSYVRGKKIDDAMTTTEAKAKMVWGANYDFLQLMVYVYVYVYVCVYEYMQGVFYQYCGLTKSAMVGKSMGSVRTSVSIESNVFVFPREHWVMNLHTPPSLPRK